MCGSLNQFGLGLLNESYSIGDKQVDSEERGVQFLLAGAEFGDAERWFRKAAEQGLRSAQMNLAQLLCLDDCPGVTSDFVQAVAWFTKAAEAVDTDAMRNLGLTYDGGGCNRKGKVKVIIRSVVASCVGHFTRPLICYR